MGYFYSWQHKPARQQRPRLRSCAAGRTQPSQRVSLPRPPPPIRAGLGHNVQLYLAFPKYPGLAAALPWGGHPTHAGSAQTPWDGAVLALRHNTKPPPSPPPNPNLPHPPPPPTSIPGHQILITRCPPRVESQQPWKEPVCGLHHHQGHLVRGRFHGAVTHFGNRDPAKGVGSIGVGGREGSKHLQVAAEGHTDPFRMRVLLSRGRQKRHRSQPCKMGCGGGGFPQMLSWLHKGSSTPSLMSAPATTSPAQGYGMQTPFLSLSTRSVRPRIAAHPNLPGGVPISGSPCSPSAETWRHGEELELPSAQGHPHPPPRGAVALPLPKTRWDGFPSP